MQTGDLTYQQEKAILAYLAEVYCKAQTIMELCQTQSNAGGNTVKMDQQAALIQLIDRTLDNCSPETRFIITHSYLRKDGSNWYLPYYAGSTYYRLKKSAIHEFTMSFRKLKD